MIALTLKQAATAMGGKLRGADASFEGVSTDSRALPAGSLFVALQGPNFDGHDYLQAALDAGAGGAVVSRVVNVDLPQIVVGDTLKALGQLARHWREQMNVRVLALTGSNGKTTVKTMTAAILGGVGPTLATEGNLNNDIGVPLTLLRLAPEHRYAVIEMGANHAGEIDYLVELAKPDVALVNNAMPSHLEGFGSIDGVAMAKGEIYGGLSDTGVALINADDHYAGLWKRIAGARLSYTFGFAEDADVLGEVLPDGSLVIHGPRGFEAELSLPLAGRHNLSNALAATALALSCGASPEQVRAGLESLQPVPGRLQFVDAACGATLINDSYNANPGSLRAAMEVLVAQAGEPWLALGSMGELGDEAAAMHAEMGQLARDLGIVRLFTTGALGREAANAFGEGAEHFDDAPEAAAVIEKDLHAGVCLLVKGSRTARMERVIDALKVGEDD